MDQSEKQISFFLVYLLKSFFWNTQLIFKQGVSKSQGINEYPIKIVAVT